MAYKNPPHLLEEWHKAMVLLVEKRGYQLLDGKITKDQRERSSTLSQT